MDWTEFDRRDPVGNRWNLDHFVASAERVVEDCLREFDRLARELEGDAPQREKRRPRRGGLDGAAARREEDARTF